MSKDSASFSLLFAFHQNLIYSQTSNRITRRVPLERPQRETSPCENKALVWQCPGLLTKSLLPLLAGRNEKEKVYMAKTLII